MEADDYNKILGYELRPRQIECMKLIDQGVSVLAELPTSYGKTSIAIYCAIICKKNNKKFFMLVPQKSLVDEHFETFKKFGLNVSLFDSDHESKLDFISKSDVCIFTYEKFNSILRKKENASLLNLINYLCIDEIHNISLNRGYAIEASMTKCKIINKNLKFLGLSATMGDESVLINTFKFVLVKADQSERPVKLVYKFEFFDDDRNKSDKLMEIIKDNINTLTFCSSRQTTENLTYMVNGKADTIENLIKNGVGYHHAGLEVDNTTNINEKKMVENAYRDGKIDKLFATTTLSAGVNLPAKRVIVFDTTRYSTLKGKIPLEPEELLQMAGRSGRNPKLDKESVCVFFILDQFRKQIIDNLKPRDITSNLNDDDNLKEFVLELIVSGIADTMLQLFECLRLSMCKIDTKRLGDTVKYLIDNKLLYQKGMTFVPSFLGRMCIVLYINIDTAIHLACTHSDGELMEVFLKVLDCKEFANQVVVRNEDHRNCEYADKYIRENTKTIDTDKLYHYDNLCKCFFLLFKNELQEYIKKCGDKTVIYFSKGEYLTLKKSADRIFTAGSIIGNPSIKNKSKLLFYALDKKSFDLEFINLHRIKGLGEKRYERLKNANISKVSEFIAMDNEKLSIILGLNTDIIANMKEEAIKLKNEDFNKNNENKGELE